MKLAIRPFQIAALRAFRSAAKPWALAICAFAWSTTTLSQEYPTRPIRLVVGFGAGGGTDILARIVAAPLGESLGQPVVVENRPGAGGTIAAHQVATAPADGYTAFLLNNGHAVSAAMYKSLPYDPAADFQPVTMLATMPLVVVAGPKTPYADLQALIAGARQSPGKLNFASVGVGSTQQFAGVLLLTDMFGGTPSNLGMTFLDKDRVEVITGVNLPMLIKLAGLRTSSDLLAVAKEMRDHGRNAIWVASDFLRGEKSGA